MKPSVFNMFARSSIAPLQAHMTKANECAQTLLPFFKASLKGDWDKAYALQLKISQAEQAADTIKRELRLNLPGGLFSPVPRADLLTLIAQQDLIANRSEDIAGIVYGRKMQLPAQIAPRVLQFLQRSLDASKQASKAVAGLEELFVMGFSGAEVKLLRQMIKKLDKIEHDTDEMQIKICAELYKFESSIPPVDVIFLYKVIEWIGDLADQAQSVGGRLQLLLAR